MAGDADRGVPRCVPWAGVAAGLGSDVGDTAVSEQALAEQALEKLPGDAVALGDGNFGIFAFAYAVQQSQRPLILRLT